jgi:hypothetical protein
MRLAAGLLGLITLPLFAADIAPGPKQSFETTTTERFPFQPGGTLRVDNSYGYLNVEGWDEPEVEVTITKSTDSFKDPDWKAKAAQFFDQIRVVTERRSDKELAISTIVPHRNSPLTSRLPSGRVIVSKPLPPRNKRGVTVEYTIRVPRNTRLVVHHDTGYVRVGDVTGDLDVTSHTGDMIVTLADPGPYAIDARTRLGSVSSDLTGKRSYQFLVGHRLVHAGDTVARRVHLRMGRGCITIQSGPPSGPFWKN